jgi:hypothetical protein
MNGIKEIEMVTIVWCRRIQKIDQLFNIKEAITKCNVIVTLQF